MPSLPAEVPGEFPDLDLGQTIRGFAAGQKLFSRYTLQRIIGRGGMGIVWLARDEELERDVALKFLPELIIHDAAVLNEMKRETKRSLELTHHNIVRIYDFAADGQSACISMEYVDGPTLSALRVQQPSKVFEVEELKPWIEQACEALDYAHRRAKIVHRDLKPANLMLNSKGDLKVADFGIARSLTDSVSMLTMRRGTSGTLVYMSPQQLDGERTSHLDDIYSLGATLYELLTSKPPFYSGDVTNQLKHKISQSIAERRRDLEIQSASAVPREWEQTIQACLAKDPTQRPQSAGEIAGRLRLQAPRARFVDAATPATAVRKRTAWVTAAAFAVFLVLVATGYYVTKLRSTNLPVAIESATPPITSPMASASAAPLTSDVKSKTGVTTSTTTTAPTASLAAESIPVGSVFGISDVAVSQTSDPNAEANIVFKITIKKRPAVTIDHTKAKIQVFFYDTVGDNDIKLTNADVSYEWLTPNHDWSDSNTETLAVTYIRPKDKISANGPRNYLGYIVRVYYNDQLQDKKAEPSKLLTLFPAPNELPGALPSPSAAVAVTPAPTEAIAPSTTLDPGKFIDGFIESLASNNTSNQLQWYADTVDYYDSGKISKESIRRDLEHDITKWPNRTYSLVDKPKIMALSGGVYQADFPMTYTLHNGGGNSTGTVLMTLKFDLSGTTGEILSAHEKVIVAHKQK